MPYAFRARTLSAIGSLIVVFTCAVSIAAPLPPGGAFVVPPEPDPTGGVVVATLVAPFASTLTASPFSGVLTTTIIRDDPSNPSANIGNPNAFLHGLTFVYELHNDATSSAALGRFTVVDYGIVLNANASYQVPTVGQLPTSVDRSNVFGVGSTIGWNFTGAPLGLGRILPGQTSAKLVVQTDAPGYVDVPANVIDGSIAQPMSYGPDLTNNVPEPASATLLLAIAGMALRRR